MQSYNSFIRILVYGYNKIIVDSDDDPDYGLAVDYGVKLGIFGK